MSRKLLVLSSMVVAMIAVSFDTSEAEAARCCRSRCNRGCGYSGGCGNYGGCGVVNRGYCGRSCGYRGGCNTGCGMAYSGGCGTACGTQVTAYNNCNAVQPCSTQGGCPVQTGIYIAQPAAGQPVNAQPAPPPPSEAPAPAPTNEPLNPAPAPGN